MNKYFTTRSVNRPWDINDWLDGEYQDIVYSLERMVDGDEEEYFGITVCCEEVSDDEEEEDS